MRWVLWSCGCLLVASVATAQEDSLGVGSRVRVRTSPVVVVPGVVEMRGAEMHALRPVRLATAQAVTIELESGEPVSVARPSQRIVGLIASADAAQLQLRTDSGRVLMVPKTGIQRVEISGETYPRSHRAGRGFWIGAIGGAVAGLILELECRGDCLSPGFLPMFWGGITGGVGALIGAFESSGETWHRVPLTALP